MRKQVNIFRIIFLSILSAFFYYFYHQISLFPTVSNFVKYPVITFVFVGILAIISLPFYFWSESGGSEDGGWLKKNILHFAHASIAYLNFLLVTVIFRDLLSFTLESILNWDVSVFYTETGFWALFLWPLLLSFLAHLIVRTGPTVVRTQIIDERIPESFHGLKIAHISDLHISDHLLTGFVDRVLKKLKNLNADIVVLTGDIVDGNLIKHSSTVEKLRHMTATHGVYYVPGNHEYYWGMRGAFDRLKSFGIRSLINESFAIQKNDDELLICGIPDPAGGHFADELVDFKKLSEGYKSNQYRILLSHQPLLADVAVDHSIHMQFSGHTHGGQFFPWNLIVGLFQKYDRGHFQVCKDNNLLNLYVNEGTGYWGPSIRLGTRCELTLVRIGNRPLGKEK